MGDVFGAEYGDVTGTYADRAQTFKADSTTALLSERGQTHGSFASNAHYGQQLRQLYRTSRHWEWMPPEHREALDMMATKISRILSGQSTFRDHWSDLAGYAKLAEDACPK